MKKEILIKKQVCFLNEFNAETERREGAEKL